ncbi:MAG: 4a-hydroxytetrahydrobiopterin dehydratase [Microcoleaceae cyanobacterium]
MDISLLLAIFGFNSWAGESFGFPLSSLTRSTQDLSAESTQRLSAVEITQQLQMLPRWQQQGQTIVYTHQFQTFIESVNFVQCLVEPVERLGHHPDLMISYNTVTVTLTTHDAGGLTPLDFRVAQAVDSVLEQWPPNKPCS